MGKGKTNKVKSKKKKGQEHIITVLKTVSVILVIMILLFIAADRFGNISFSSVGDYVSTVISGTKKGDGYPYGFDSLQVKDIKQIGSDVILINDTSTIVLDSTARKVSTIQHTYSNPVCFENSGRAILLDIGGNTYRVISKTKTLYDGTTDNKIMTGAIGKDGTVAIAERGSSSQSKLTIYNNNQKVIFSWLCAKENIVAVDISDNGKLAAVSVVGAENGELYSKVLIFNFSFADAVSEFDIGSSVVSNVQFLADDTLLVSGEDVFSIIKNKTERNDEDLSLNTLSRISTSDTNVTAVILSKYGSSSSKILNVYNKRGKLVFSADIDSAVKSVSCDNQHVSVLTSTELINYNMKGEVVGTAAVESDGIRCFTDNTYAYVYSTSKVSLYKINGTNSETSTVSAN